MHERDTQKPETGHDTDLSKAQSGQQPAKTSDDTKATQTEGFKQPEGGSDQQVDSAGETTTLGEQGTDIEGESKSSDGGFVGSQSQQDASSKLVDDNRNIDKDGQPPLDGE